MTIVGLNQAVLVTILQHLYVLPPVTFLREFRLAYEMYHTRILFFERYVCRPTLTYSILEYRKTSDRSPRLLLVQFTLTPGLYPGPGV